MLVWLLMVHNVMLTCKMELIKPMLWCPLLIVGVVVGFAFNHYGLMFGTIHIRLQVACVLAVVRILLCGTHPRPVFPIYLHFIF